MKPSPRPNPSPPPVLDPRRRTLPSLLSPLAFLAFALLIVFLTLHTDRAARSFSACAVPPDTIQGIPEPRFFLETDSYVWLSHARDLIASGGWRLRHTFMDNAPYGRPMHWSHLLIWSILLPAKAIMALAHWPAARAVELVGVWVMPAWHVAFLALLFFALPRRIGLLPTAILALLAVSNECIAIVAFPLKPDHHIFQMAFGTAFFLCLQWAATAGFPAPPSSPLPPRRLPLCGFPPPPSPAEALRAATAAGVFLGLLYWIGATVAFFVLALGSLAVLPLLPCFRTPVPAPSPLPPALWRRFALAAVSVAAACWLLEYAPHHFSMRLEVNHPLHWLPILGTALGLASLSSLPRRPRPADFLSPRLLLSAALCLSLPLAVAFGPVSWHLLKDPLLQRLHATYINEFHPFLPTPLALLATFRLPALALLLTPVALFFSKRLPFATCVRAVLLSSFLFALFFFGAICWQHRWGFLFAAALSALAIFLSLAILETRSVRSSRFPAAAVLLFATLASVDAIHALGTRIRDENRIANASVIPEAWIGNDMAKRTALRLAFEMGTNSWSVAGRPTEAPSLYYYASIPSLASFYWENAPGWHAETAIMADMSSGFANAVAVASSRRLTHLLASPSSDTPNLFLHIGTGVSNQYTAARRTFCGHLTHPQLCPLLPPAIREDPALNNAVTQRVVFRTPSGYAQESPKCLFFAAPAPDNEKYPLP